LSPEQVVWKSIKDCVSWVSQETIYKYVWEDKKKGGDLYKHLMTLGKTYRKRGASKDKRVQIIGIEKRPIEVDEKQIFGDLEIDLVIGKTTTLQTHTAAEKEVQNENLNGLVRQYLKRFRLQFDNR
jgi:IS30 family transposase